MGKKGRQFSEDKINRCDTAELAEMMAMTKKGRHFFRKK